MTTEVKPKTLTSTVGVRLSAELLALLDEEVARRQKATPWLEVSRADVVREAVYRLLTGPPLTPPSIPT